MYKALLVRCQRCTKKKKRNKKKIMLRCIVIGACAVQFLHYVPLYRNTQLYATLNCSIKRVYATEAHKILYIFLRSLGNYIFLCSLGNAFSVEFHTIFRKRICEIEMRKTCGKQWSYSEMEMRGEGSKAQITDV